MSGSVSTHLRMLLVCPGPIENPSHSYDSLKLSRNGYLADNAVTDSVNLEAYPSSQSEPAQGALIQRGPSAWPPLHDRVMLHQNKNKALDNGSRFLQRGELFDSQFQPATFLGPCLDSGPLNLVHGQGFSTAALTKG